MAKYIAIQGNLETGFIFHGPYDTAQEIIDSFEGIRTDVWTLAELRPPNEEDEDA